MALFPPEKTDSPANRLAAVDIFAGLGGLTHGLNEAGFIVRAAVESSRLAVDGYRANHKTSWIWHEKIQDVEPRTVLRTIRLRPGQLPLLAGCPPCEGFSRLRSKNGRHAIVDPRNDLLFEIERFWKAMRPWAVMIENVPGLAIDDRFKRFVQDLEHASYNVTWDILDAADFGVPQRRKRLIMIASRIAKPRLPDPEGGSVSVANAIKGLPQPGQGDDPAHNAVMRHSERIRNLIRSIPADGGSRTDLPEGERLKCHEDFDGFKDVYGRMSWDGPAPTITGGCASPSKGRFLHPTQDRVISLREAALLQGFPRGYVIPLSRGRYAAAELIGNALPPEFIRQTAVPLQSQLKKEALRRSARSRRRARNGDG